MSWQSKPMTYKMLMRSEQDAKAFRLLGASEHRRRSVQSAPLQPAGFSMELQKKPPGIIAQNRPNVGRAFCQSPNNCGFIERLQRHIQDQPYRERWPGGYLICSLEFIIDVHLCRFGVVAPVEYGSTHDDQMGQAARKTRFQPYRIRYIGERTRRFGDFFFIFGIYS